MLTATLSLPYGAQPHQSLDVFVPDDAQGPLVACIGAGWWADGRSASGRMFALALAEAGLAVATLGHRPLGHGARTGDEVLGDLAEAAVKALEEAQVLGFGGRSLALLGHGSGSLPAFLLPARLARKAAVRAVIACGVLASLQEAPDQPACDRFAMGRHRDLSPIHIDPSSMPPALLVEGIATVEAPRGQAQAMQQHLAAAGDVARLEAVSSEADLPRLIAAFVAEHAREPALGVPLFG